MRVIVRSAPVPPANDDQLRLLAPETSRWDELGGNLVALIDTMTRRRPWDARPPFQIVTQPAWDPRRSMTASLFCHTAVVFLLFNLTALLRFAGDDDHPQHARLDTQRLQWYVMSDQLPAIGDSSKDRKTPAAKGAKHKADARPNVHHPQKIVSSPENPDNNAQTIVQPDVPKIKLTQNLALPNLVMWQDIERPAPPVDLVKAPLRVPAELVKHDVPLPPELPNLERKLGDLKVAASLAPLPAPALPVEPATTAAGNTPPAPAPAPAPPEPPPPDTSAIGGGAEAEARIRKVVVLNATPAPPPPGPIDVPKGNRAGAFNAGPDATPAPESGAKSPGAGGPANDAAAHAGNDARRDLATGLHIPGLSISGNGAPTAAAIVNGPPRAVLPRPTTPAAPTSPDVGSTRPKPAPIHPDIPDSGFPPGKRIYTVFLNMPSLTSATNASWLMRFAELEVRPAGTPEVAISAPVATHKVDPGYEPDAARERIEGKVQLHVIIRRDGHVDTVEVLHSLDPRLDQRAINAFLKWHFQPALREGVPVDLEAVIEIPFTLPAVRHDFAPH